MEKKFIGFNLDLEIYKKIKIKCVEMDISFTNFIVKLLTDWLENN